MKALSEIKLPSVAADSDSAARRAEQWNQARLNQNFIALFKAVLEVEEAIAELSAALPLQTPAPMAFVSAVGADGLWRWRKWSDGTIEAWTTTLDAAINCTTGAGSIFRAEAHIRLPDGLFASIETMNVSAVSASPLAVSIKGWTATQATVTILSPTSANVSVRFSVHVFGK